MQYKRGDAAEAVSSFTDALALRPESASIRYRLGLALAKNGASAEARTAFEKAISGNSFPEIDAAKAELALLEES